jgi:flagellar protein FlbD
MIRLTRLNNRPLVVNSELIKFIENAPDTVITLVTGEKVVVRETTEEVMNQIVDYRRRLLSPQVGVAPSGGPLAQPEEPVEDEE